MVENIKVTPGKLMHRIRGTEIYDEISETKVGKGELTNPQLIKQLFSRSDVLHPAILFINGKIDMKSAIEDFIEKINPLIKRYEHINRFGERLFFEVSKAIKDILKIRNETNEQIDKVLKGSPEDVELQTDSSIDLKKEESIRLKNTKQLQIIIDRAEQEQDHELNVLKRGDYLEVWCSSSDSEEGKKMILRIEKDSEYSIGQAEKTITERAKQKIEKAKEEYKKAKSEHEKYYSLSAVSLETEEAKDRMTRANARLQIAKFEMDKLMQNPVQHWFDSEKSPDISKDHIIIEYTDEGVMVITDEGEQCSARLVRVE